MKRLLLLILLAIPIIAAAQDSNKELLLRLDSLLKQKPVFYKQKEQRINKLKDDLKGYNGNNLEGEFKTCMKLFNEYRSFLYDSAYYFVEQAKRKAVLSGNSNLLSYAKVKQGFVFLSSGLFKESLDTLQSINVERLPDTLKVEYYTTIARTYFDLADYDKDPVFGDKYKMKGNAYLDKALQLVSPNSSMYWSVVSLKQMKVPNWEEAARSFKYWIENYRLTDHEYAIATSSLGYIYTELKQPEEAKKYMILASIADVKASTRETVALRNLSSLLFKEGDTKTSYSYITEALNDASRYNARHRKIEIATILPIIEGERLTTVEAQKSRLIGYSAAITVLVVLVVVFMAIIYSQLTRLKKVKIALQETNDNLNKINGSLKEANTIKEEYIGYFFNVNSEFIDRLDSYQKSIHRKVVARQFDDLLTIIKNAELKKERELLYSNFDKIFVKLFPNFIREFNSLFKEEDRIYPRQDELLTPELRIYAMMRLGIKDNEKIARFLNYTVSTIYTYKTKIKAKSLCREVFEDRVMEISAF